MKQYITDHRKKKVAYRVVFIKIADTENGKRG